MSFIQSIRKGFFSSHHLKYSSYFDAIGNNLRPINILKERMVNTSRRFVSNTPSPPLSKALANGRASFIRIHELSNQEKTEEVFAQALKRILIQLDKESTAMTIAEQWSLLENTLGRQAYIPPLDLEDMSTNVQFLFKQIIRPLVIGDRVFMDFQWSDFIHTPTELSWSMAPVGIPFTRLPETITTDLENVKDILTQVSAFSKKTHPSEKLSLLEKKVKSYSLLNSEKDAAAAILMAVPYLDETTLLHEIGCWNGQNLLNLLFHTALEGKFPLCCIGTDINPSALAMAETAANLLNLNPPHLQFHLANALDPFNPSMFNLEFEKEMKLALRILPVLDPKNGADFLRNIKNSFQSEDSCLLISYALPRGKMFEENKRRAADSSLPEFFKEDFAYGVTFKQKFSSNRNPHSLFQKLPHADIVLNTYYSSDGFHKLIRECGFKIEHTVIVHDQDNERIAVLLRPE